MNFLLILSFFIYSPILFAETIKSRIYSIEDGLIKFENGRVAFIEKKSYDLKPEDYIKANLDQESNLLSYKKIESKKINIHELTLSLAEEDAEFRPTIVRSMKEAQKIFDRSNPYYKRISECSDRAHVWSHEEFKKTGTKSMKAFVFFTASYINSVRFKWWFHVAPMYKVKDRGVIKDIVMDFRYTSGPMTVKEWTDQFVFTKRSCKVTNLFSEYDVNPQTENCYLMFESMHYKIPLDIVERDKFNKPKTKTSESEIRASYKFSFNN